MIHMCHLKISNPPIVLELSVLIISITSDNIPKNLLIYLVKLFLMILKILSLEF